MSDGNELKQADPVGEERNEQDLLADSIGYRWNHILYESAAAIILDVGAEMKQTVFGYLIVSAIIFAQDNGLSTDTINDIVSVALENE